MAAARGFDAELAQLEQLRHAESSTTEVPLHKALRRFRKIEPRGVNQVGPRFG